MFFRKYLAAAVIAGLFTTSHGIAQEFAVPPGPEAATPVAFPDAGRRQVQLDVYLTGYSFWDNTPPGSARIARPVIHRQAGGSGTYADPVTLAVGHSKRGGRSQMDFPSGTRFYFPMLRKYAIVEDLCGDGPRPQLGPCHTGRAGRPWVDIYVGGRHQNPNFVDRCMRRITGFQTAILNPAPGLPVLPGEIAQSNCLSI